MQGRAAQFVCLVEVALLGMSIFAPPAYSQTQQGETLSGPDSHETGLGPHGHLFGDGNTER
jgi:porin